MPTRAESQFNRGDDEPTGAYERPAGFLILVAAAIFVPLAFFTVGASGAISGVLGAYS